MGRPKFDSISTQVFAESRFSGLPVMRPLWAEFPSDSGALLLDDQWMVGSALLVKPVTEQGASHVDAYLPPGRWYEVHRLCGNQTVS